MLQSAVLSSPDLSGLILPDKIGIEFAVATAERYPADSDTIELIRQPDIGR
jgi:hypothetical protein